MSARIAPLLLALFAPAQVADLRVDAALQERIDGAIERGLIFLLRHEDLFADEPHAPDYPGGPECLVFYTLRICGVSPDEPLSVVTEAAAIAAARDSEQTYTLSLALLGLLHADRQQHADRIAQLVERLEAGQLEGGRARGGYGYQCPGGRSENEPDDRSRRVAHWNPPSDWHDNSNTQYAILALRAAHDFGFEVDREVFERAARYFLDQARADGGFGYSGTHRRTPYAAMTAGVLGSLVMCSDVLADRSADSGLRHRIERTVDKGVGWLEKHLDFPMTGAAWPYYGAYAVERLGHHVGSERIGKRRWYEEGARWMVAVQREDGGFSAEPGPSRVVQTCFALLFLKRSSAVHTAMSDEVAVLLRKIDVQARSADLDHVRGRIRRAGIHAVPHLVRGLYLPAAPAAALADEMLRELTGEDMGFQGAPDDEARRRARERWVQWLLAHPEFQPTDPP